jgi:shikimate kinase
MSIKEIFAAEGETGFRDRESAVTVELTKRQDLIVAWGGGVILREANRAALTSSGRVIWLRAKGLTLLQRITQDPTTTARRPNLTSAGGLAEIEQLLAARAELYAAVADWAIDVDELAPGQVTDHITHWLRENEANVSAKGGF